MTGMAYLEVVFGTEAQSAAGRQQIRERLAALRGTLPATARVLMGPDASSTGWVFQYAVVDPGHRLPQRALRRLQDDVIRPRLAAIPGVAEVASVGGTTQELFIEARPQALGARGLAFSDVATAVAAVDRAARPRASGICGARLVGAAAPAGDARPSRLADVAELHVIDGMPTGMADVDGTLVAVGGVVIAARHADLAQVVGHVRAALGELRRALPPRRSDRGRLRPPRPGARGRPHPAPDAARGDRGRRRRRAPVSRQPAQRADAGGDVGAGPAFHVRGDVGAGHSGHHRQPGRHRHRARGRRRRRGGRAGRLPSRAGGGRPGARRSNSVGWPFCRRPAPSAPRS